MHEFLRLTFAYSFSSSVTWKVQMHVRSNGFRLFCFLFPFRWAYIEFAHALTFVKISGYPMRSFIELAFSLATDRVSSSIQSFSSSSSLNASRIKWIISNADSLLSELKFSRMNRAPTAKPIFLFVQSTHCDQRWRSDRMPNKMRWNSSLSFWYSSMKCETRENTIRQST